MNNRDLKTIFGELLCSMLPYPIVKAGIHANIRNEYERDYIFVTNLYEGFCYTTKISMKVIDGAKEWYIQNNKSILEVAPLADDQKKEVSASIEANAESLKQRWIQTFENMHITILQ